MRQDDQRADPGAAERGGERRLISMLNNDEKRREREAREIGDLVAAAVLRAGAGRQAIPETQMEDLLSDA